MGELSQAMQIGAALPELQRQEIEKLIPLLSRLPISDVMSIREAIEHRSQHGGGPLLESLMAVKELHVRVAEWHVVEYRCEHKRYAVGGTSSARHGEIGDETWLEAWIA